MDDKSAIEANYKNIGKKGYIEKEKYKTNLNYINKKNEKIFRCKFYNDKKIKCSAFAKFDQKGVLVYYNNNHSCIFNEKKVKTLLTKNEAKKTIDNMRIIYNINCKDLYNTSLNKIQKRKSDEYSDEKSNNNIDIKKYSSILCFS